MTEVVVIGAGPYGLSIAANLQRSGIPFRIFGRTMSMWRDNMPAGMFLKSDGFASSFGGMPLTLEEFCRRTGRAYGHVGHRTPIADIIAYGDAFQREYIGDVDERRVVAVSPYNARFIVRLADGEEILTRKVMVATGLMGFERRPTVDGLPSERMTHASEHNDLSVFAGKRVVVIGGGQSAFETSALLHEQGASQVTVLSRRKPFWFDPEGESVPSTWTRLRHPNWGLGPGWKSWLWSEAPNLFSRLPASMRLNKAYSTFGPAGSGWLKHRVVGVDGIKLGVGTIHSAIAEDHEVTLAVKHDNFRWPETADHVIAATGYKANLHMIDFLRPLLNAKRADMRWASDGIPSLNRRFETSIPGLHIAGYPSALSLGPSMRFIYGTNWAAPRIVRNLGYPVRTVVGPVVKDLTSVNA
jgi:FAD-dependent urate hydroxylase